MVHVYQISIHLASPHYFKQFIFRYYGEYHDWQPTGWAKKDKEQIRTDIRSAGFKMIDWVGERRTYSDINDMNPIRVRTL